MIMAVGVEMWYNRYGRGGVGRSVKLVYICHNLYGSDTKVVWCSSIEGSITYEV